MSTQIEHSNNVKSTPKIPLIEISQLEQTEKIGVGMRRGWIQIKKTVSFEFLRNAKKFMAMLITALGIYLLFLIIQLIQENQGAEMPTEAVDYFQSYLGMIDLLILIIGTTFFGSIIAEDFEKQTGNLLFPKIPKERLLIGRFFARYVYAALSVAFFYLLVGITTFIEYNGVPKIVWGSMLWAEWYLFGVSAFITMLSSMFKRSATAMISGLLLLLIIFNLLSMIFMFTGITAEPLYFLTYYSNIIIEWFNMPADDNRFREIAFKRGPGVEASDGNTYYQWITPSATGAIVGLLIYAVICLAIAYFVYKRKQV
ncbi:MAG: ABC transporter permease [Candidatus Lokiarchaeota archaeon]|nr:ABC transporter permease [Candidatus Harpocratesius repetitus]